MKPKQTNVLTLSPRKCEKFESSVKPKQTNVPSLNEIVVTGLRVV